MWAIAKLAFAAVATGTLAAGSPGVFLRQLRASTIQTSRASFPLGRPWEPVLVNVSRLEGPTVDTASDVEALEAPSEQHLQPNEGQSFVRLQTAAQDGAGQMEGLVSLWKSEDAKIQHERARETHASRKAEKASSDLALREKSVWDLQHKLQQARAESSATLAMRERLERDRAAATRNESEAHEGFVAAQTLLDKYVDKTAELAQKQAELDVNRSSLENESQRTSQFLHELFENGSSARSGHETFMKEREHEDDALMHTIDDEARASRELKLIAQRRDANEKIISYAEQKTATTASKYNVTVGHMHEQQSAQMWQQQIRVAATRQRKKAENHSSILEGLVRTWQVQESEAHVRAVQADDKLMNRNRMANDLEARRAAVADRFHTLNAEASSDRAIVTEQQAKEAGARSQRTSAEAQLKRSIEASREWTTKEKLAHQALFEANERISDIKNNVTGWRKAEEAAHERRQQAEHQREAMLRAALAAHGGANADAEP